jgi:methylmalonyl-CoA mutase cobalamin-binding subunit
MTYRIEASHDADAVGLSFEGLLDGAALEAVAAAVAAARARGASGVALVLAPGTTVDRECLAALRSIDGLSVKGASPFLAAWLAQCGVK